MTTVTKKRLAAVSALTLAASVLGYLAYGGIEENLVYFWDPAQLLARGDKAYGATVRLGGVVREGTYHWDPETLDLRFDVAMDKSDSQTAVSVVAGGAPPQMFRENIGVVVEGVYDGKYFHADRVIVKHSNEYRPPEAGEKPQELYKTLLDES
ncbi:MAG: cytochrome c maturation protein CcmE [Myxococcota bacterium]